ncbi:MAG: adenylate/guanylate cyclase domain-containing protein [Armatimonadota bacterium]|nr:adenylate/guanylate cyclase domain-containing protein [Armatimonadota bacterium]
MYEATRVRAQYIFLDVEGFTKGRSVEAQTDIINALNGAVQECIGHTKLPRDKVLLLPTGDGICISILGEAEPYDIQLMLALDILRHIAEHNSTESKEARRFRVRIGLNSNVDVLVTDVTGRLNIAGAGINMAQRIMGLADGGQLLLGRSVYDVLSQTEKYMHKFREYQTSVKHGAALQVYQYVDEDFPFALNTKEPSTIVQKPKIEPKLDKLSAYFFAHAIRNREFLLHAPDRNGDFHTAPVLLWLLATDSVERSEARETSLLYPKTYGAKRLLPISDQFAYYSKQDSCLRGQVAYDVRRIVSDKYKSECFEGADGLEWWFITPAGKEKLKREWPAIWEEFRLSD